MALDTNQLTLPYAALQRFDAPDVMWWAQPPDLLRHAPGLFANQPWDPPLWLQPPGAWWWAQPPDLLKHPRPLDTNQLTLPFAALQRFDTPDVMWWSQPPNLLRHLPPMDTNFWTISICVASWLRNAVEDVVVATAGLAPSRSATRHEFPLVRSTRPRG